MNKLIFKLFLVLIMLIQIDLINGQSIYFKSTGAFEVPISQQTIPDYFTFQIYTPSTAGGSLNAIQKYDAKFSLGKGINIEEALGYNLNNLISFEIGISYYTNIKRKFITYLGNGLTNWHYQNVCLMPEIIIGKNVSEKSRVNFLLSPGFGISNVKVTASMSDYFTTYSFKSGISYSLGYGFEYLHKLFSKIQLSINAGLNHLFYTPKYAEAVSSTVNPEYLPIYYKQIDYVKKIVNDDKWFEKPGKRLQETLKVNSIYLGVGVKYTLFNN
jgi:hypothetical protein